MTFMPPPMPPQSYGAATASPTVRQTPNLAVAAMVLGCCAFIPCLGLIAGPLAVVFAIIVLCNRKANKGLAVGGLCIALAGVLFVQGLMLAMLLPALQRSRELARRAACASNLYAIGKSVYNYRAEHNDAFPPSLELLVEQGYLSAEKLKCPSSDGRRDCDYFYWPNPSNRENGSWMACDLKGNHENYRNLLRDDASVGNDREKGFQAGLREESNAAFAEALRKVEGP